MHEQTRRKCPETFDAPKHLGEGTFKEPRLTMYGKRGCSWQLILSSAKSGFKEVPWSLGSYFVQEFQSLAYHTSTT